MKTLSIDLETHSSVDLGKSSVYRYVESPDFDILLFGYSVDGGDVQVVDLAQGEQIPPDIIEALSDERVHKWAFNANFERVCLSEWLRRNGYPLNNEYYSIPDDPCMDYLDPAGWYCTMVWSAYLGLPLSLKDVGAALGLDKQKLTEGKDLIRYFCVPGKDGKRHQPSDAPDKWQTFRSYNLRDVETEMAIQERLKKYPVPDEVWEQYHLDQQINDRGIAVDMQLVRNAIAMDKCSREELNSKLQELTMLDNPNSVQQMKVWLSENGLETDTLVKKQVIELLKTAPEPLCSVLMLRQQLAKSSVKKYQAMEATVCADGRVRGCFQFYGANRTGRFSGRNVQLQNLCRNDMPDLAQARAIVRAGDYDAVRLLYDSTPDVLSQLIRTAFVPRSGRTFIVADFSAIEARVIAWLAGEEWRMELFRNGGDIYCMSASQMFKVPVEKHGINGHLRQRGKVAELACVAEGQLVLTDGGLVPIQDVTTKMKVWDGENWVTHEGLAYRGEKEVITYEGLTATPDHLVWVEGQSKPIQFGVAAASGAHLVQTGDGGNAVLLIDYYPNRASEVKALVRHPRKVKVYDIRNAGEYHRFTVSGKLVHNCGYGGSVGALKAMGALEMGLKEEELKPLVDAWRKANSHIVQLWWDVDEAVKRAIAQRCTIATHGLKFSYQSGMLFITLPSGRQLSYVKPRIGENSFGGSSITYMGTDSAHRWTRLESYGPKFVENCIAEGTLVLTQRGFVPIEQVQLNDMLWDGVEWVCHEGLIHQGMKETISVDGVRMTPEHKILTTDGWRQACECGGLRWAAVTLPDGNVQAESTVLIDPAKRSEQVYDIRNCGLRHRFCVYDRQAGKLRIVSNCVQAISRDILCYAMQTLSHCAIVAHVHDELIIEANPRMSLDAVCEQMARTPPWAQGLQLRADGYTTDFYKKD